MRAGAGRRDTLARQPHSPGWIGWHRAVGALELLPEATQPGIGWVWHRQRAQRVAGRVDRPGQAGQARAIAAERLEHGEQLGAPQPDLAIVIAMRGDDLEIWRWDAGRPRRLM